MRLTMAWMPALLAKELIELAQLKRTCVKRVVYAVVYLAVLVGMRMHCLRRGTALLGRLG
jgi:hypothetical protein